MMRYNNDMMAYYIYQANCTRFLNSIDQQVDLTFLGPPFNHSKQYALHDDTLPEEQYWSWMQIICQLIYKASTEGGCIYFMQREKNTEVVLRCLRQARWTFQNLIIWKKKASAVSSRFRVGKHYQIIAYATKGERPRVFNRLHNQQAPIALLLCIILASAQIGDTVLDPFVGTGTTLVVARQLKRHSIGIEIDPKNVELIRNRVTHIRKIDRIDRFIDDYRYTEELNSIWQTEQIEHPTDDIFDLPLFRSSEGKL